MAIYPGAVYKPTGYGGRTARNKQGRGMLHVAVSRARSLPPWNANTWHFYVALDGYCEQYVDTAYRAYGGAEGNDDQIIVETAGGTGSSEELNAEQWTPAQAARIADIMVWESKQPGGAPLELLPDARPGRRGWGPHRLGIKHSGGPRPGWWQPGSEIWSNALGKECPGDAKVRQIPQIIEMARSGQTGGDELSAEFEQKATVWMEDILRRVQSMHVFGFGQVPLDRVPNWRDGGDLTFLDRKLQQTVAPLVSEVAVLRAALAEGGSELNGAALYDIARKAADDALKARIDSAKVELSVSDGNQPPA